MELKQAQKIAQSLIVDLKPFCHRIEIGGSIRCKKTEVKDIELVCIPEFGQFPIGQMSLEGDPLTSFENLLFEHIAANRDKYDIIKMGEKYAQIEVFDEHATGVRQYIKVDIFTVTFGTWDYIFLLRTGPAEFSKIAECCKYGEDPSEDETKAFVEMDEAHERLMGEPPEAW